jgi:hypothetical protein
MEETNIQILVKARRQILSGDVDIEYVKIEDTKIPVTKEDAFVVCARIHADTKTLCHLKKYGYPICVSCQQ